MGGSVVYLLSGKGPFASRDEKMFISKEEATARLQRGDAFTPSESAKHDRVPMAPPPRAPEAEVVEDEKEDEFDELVERALAIGTESERRGSGHIRGKGNQAHYANRISEQKAIADVALIAGQGVAQDLFGLSQSQAHAYERGQRSSNLQMGRDTDLMTHVNSTKESIRKIAAKKLELALDSLTDEKISKVARATDIGRLAKDLATVHDKMERKDSGENAAQFHIFVPEVKQINNYNVIRISSEPKEKDLGQI